MTTEFCLYENFMDAIEFPPESSLFCEDRGMVDAP